MELSPRQINVLHGLALGLTNRQIAFALGIGHQTVKNHLTELYDRLLPRRQRNQQHRLLAVLEAMRQGMLDDIMRT